ncbi:MAG: arylesterase [Pseudobacteriovorax sp.]|nr:arylesterase [Pseudobacteriovorax sp.]
MSKIPAFLLICLLTSPCLFGNEKSKILALGDSLTFGYGVEDQDSWPQLLAKRLNKTIVNGGTSGATTAFAMPTLKFHLKRYKPELVIYALGANDALRGISVEEIRKNMREALDFLKAKDVPVVMLGMKAPPNYGETFPKDFQKIYTDLAAEYKVPIYPFLLEGVAGEAKLNQSDGIHPNPEGYKVIANNLYKFMKDYYAKRNTGNIPAK